MAVRERNLNKEEARLFILMGAIFLSTGLIIFLFTRLAGIGLTVMGFFFLVVGGYYFIRK